MEDKKLNYSGFTRFMRTLYSDVEVKRSNSTETVYYIFPELKVRISMHTKLDIQSSDSDLDIVVPMVSMSDVYVVRLKDNLSFLTLTLKELKEFVRHEYFLSKLNKFKFRETEGKIRFVQRNKIKMIPAEIGNHLNIDIPNMSFASKKIRRLVISKVIKIGDYEKALPVIKETLGKLTVKQLKEFGASGVEKLIDKKLNDLTNDKS